MVLLDTSVSAVVDSFGSVWFRLSCFNIERKGKDSKKQRRRCRDLSLIVNKLWTPALRKWFGCMISVNLFTVTTRLYYPICPFTAISSYSIFKASVLFKARVDTGEDRILRMSMWSSIVLQIHVLWDRRSAQRVIVWVIQVTFVDTWCSLEEWSVIGKGVKHHW